MILELGPSPARCTMAGIIAVGVKASARAKPCDIRVGVVIKVNRGSLNMMISEPA